MLTVTSPIGLDAHHVWVFVCAPTGAVDAARIAHAPGTARFIALPCLAFDTTTLLPTLPHTGEPLPGFCWATTADIDGHAHLFTAKEPH